MFVPTYIPEFRMPVLSSPAPIYRLFVGVDIAAKTLTAAWQAPGGAPGRPLTLEQTPAGFARLQSRLRASGAEPAATLVVMEATGSYWVALATTLTRAGFRVSAINPAQAHHFAKALLKRAKTDAIDAQTLAQLAALLQPAPWTPPPAVYTEVQQRLVERDTLVAMRQQVRNQRHALAQLPVVVASVRERMDALIATLEGQIAAVDGELAVALRQDAAWSAAAERLRSIPGIGPVTAGWLLVGTLNFTLCPTPEAATAYAGLAPVPRESGSSVRGRAAIGHSGHARLRTALYLASLSAAQHNPAIKAFYQRLLAAGKPKKVARCAAARKLLHLAWAVVRHEVPFDPSYAGRARQPAA
jgi:transposase